MQRFLPSYPLWIIDPNFSIWSPHDALTDGETTFWAGQVRRTFGFVRWNGITYRFLGHLRRACALRQTDVRVTAFGTECIFEGDDFRLHVEFLSPLPPDDKELASCPVCFTRYRVETDAELPDDFCVSLAMHEEFCYSQERVPVVGGVLPLGEFEAAFMTRGRNLVMSAMSDNCPPDWGDTYLAGEESWFVTETAFYDFVASGIMEYGRRELESGYLVAVNRTKEGTFLTAFDDKVSIFYFGEWLKGYYFRGGKTIVDALRESMARREEIYAQCAAFDEDLKEKCLAIGEDYYLLACAALRQTMGAHKLVQDNKGRLLFLSRECDSNSCIGTADVSYPSIPLFLLYDPELVNGMLRGIFDFARMPVWTFDFAPHDVGTYPWCCGQTYGLNRSEDKYSCGLNWFWMVRRTFTMLYLRPAESNVYSIAGQMPVEECGNMLIMTAAAMAVGGGTQLAQENFDLLTKWADYLLEHGLGSESQLCTDDFAGHLAGNVNLTLKAMTGLCCYGEICRRLNQTCEKKYAEGAKKLAQKALSAANGGVMPLAYGRDGSYSLKYNLLFEKLFGFGLVGQNVIEREIEYYLTKSLAYGIPLDERAQYTKSDWLLWCAALTEDPAKRDALYKPVVRYLAESSSRVPFGDWYDADNGRIENFVNRTVQGGIFAPLLKDIFGKEDK